MAKRTVLVAGVVIGSDHRGSVPSKNRVAKHSDNFTEGSLAPDRFLIPQQRLDGCDVNENRPVL
jgi:hypothetical protein